jgi:hypothetical protein
MTNIEAVERFDQSHSVRISKLFWIAGSLSDSDLEDFLQELDDEYLDKWFPDADYLNQYRDDSQLVQAFVDFNKFGMIAEINIPKADNFKYEKDKPVSWSVHEGNCRVEYVYAETLELLMNEIEKTSESVFQEYIKKDKKKATA